MRSLLKRKLSVVSFILLTSSLLTTHAAAFWCPAWPGSDEYTYLSGFGGVTAQVSQSCGGAFANLYLHAKGYNLIDPFAGRSVQVAMWRNIGADACPSWGGYQSPDNPTQGGYVNYACSVEYGNPSSVWVYDNKTHFSGPAVNFVGGAPTSWSFYGWLDNTNTQNVAYIQYREDWSYNGTSQLTGQNAEAAFFFNPQLYYQKQAHLIINGVDKGFVTQTTTYSNVSWAAIYIPGDNVALVMKPTSSYPGQTVLYNNNLYFRLYNVVGDSLVAASFQYNGYINPGGHVAIGMLMYVGSKTGVCGLGYCW